MVAAARSTGRRALAFRAISRAASHSPETLSYKPYTYDDLLNELRRINVEHRFVIAALINQDLRSPTARYFTDQHILSRRLGGLKAAYARVGYLSDQSTIVKAALKHLAAQAPMLKRREARMLRVPPVRAAFH